MMKLQMLLHLLKQIVAIGIPGIPAIVLLIPIQKNQVLIIHPINSLLMSKTKNNRLLQIFHVSEGFITGGYLFISNVGLFFRNMQFSTFFSSSVISIQTGVTDMRLMQYI